MAVVAKESTRDNFIPTLNLPADKVKFRRLIIGRLGFSEKALDRIDAGCQYVATNYNPKGKVGTEVSFYDGEFNYSVLYCLYNGETLHHKYKDNKITEVTYTPNTRNYKDEGVERRNFSVIILN